MKCAVAEIASHQTRSATKMAANLAARIPVDLVKSVVMKVAGSVQRQVDSVRQTNAKTNRSWQDDAQGWFTVDWPKYPFPAERNRPRKLMPKRKGIHLVLASVRHKVSRIQVFGESSTIHVSKQSSNLFGDERDGMKEVK